MKRTDARRPGSWGSVTIFLTVTVATALGVFSAFAALTVPAASARPATAAEPLQPFQLRLDDQTFGIASGDQFEATFTLSGAVADIDALERVIAPPPPSTTSTVTSIRTSTPAPTTVASSSPGAASPTPPSSPSTASTLATVSAPSGTDTASSSAQVVITAYQRIPDLDGLSQFDDHRPTQPADSVALPAAGVLTIADGGLAGQVAVPLTISPSAAGPADTLDLDQAGIYPISIRVEINGEVTASTTTFIQLSDPEQPVEAPLTVSILAAVDDPGPWPSPAELTRATAEMQKLIELGTAVDGPLSIGLPPVLVETLTTPDPSGPAVIGTPNPAASVSDQSAPPTAPGSPASGDIGGTSDSTTIDGGPERSVAAVELASAFRADELLAVPAVALDPSAIVAVERADLFTDQLRRGEDIVSTASPLASVSRSVWVSDRPISAPAAVVLRNLGIRMFLLSDGAAADLGLPGEGSTGIFRISLDDGATLPGMTVSPRGALLQTPASPAADETPNDVAVRLAVELSLDHEARDIPAVVLATPGMAVPDPDITARFVDFVDEMPDAAVVPLSRLPGTVEGALAPTGSSVSPTVALPERAGADLAARVTDITAAVDDAGHASSMLVEPARGRRWIADLERLFSSELDDDTVSERLGLIVDEVDAVFDAIVPPDPFTFTLTGTSNTLRLAIGNTSAEPLNVLVRLRSPKLIFPEQASAVEVPAGSATTVEVPVEARSNGTFTIEVDVLAPDQERIAGPVILKARVSRLSGLSQVVTGGALLVLASWWYSHLRRRRRLRVAGAAIDAATTAALIDATPPYTTQPYDGSSRVSPDADEAVAVVDPLDRAGRPQHPSSSDPAGATGSAEPPIEPG